jgi:hypothetical protein
MLADAPLAVMPAKAGIQGKRRDLWLWIAAFAGMAAFEAGAR